MQPGDEIKSVRRVEDNDPAGAKGSESSVVVVKIISAAEFDRMERGTAGLELLQSKYNQAQLEMAELRDRPIACKRRRPRQPDEDDRADRTGSRSS